MPRPTLQASKSPDLYTTPFPSSFFWDFPARLIIALQFFQCFFWARNLHPRATMARSCSAKVAFR